MEREVGHSFAAPRFGAAIDRYLYMSPRLPTRKTVTVTV